jgi:tetratricopeptide (TPR) repeat protein/cell division septation protein DedD
LAKLADFFLLKIMIFKEILQLPAFLDHCQKKLHIMKLCKRPLIVLVILFWCTAAFSQSALKRASKDYEISDFHSAVTSYVEFLKNNPGNVEANSKIADCYRIMNQLEEALPYYQAAIARPGVEDIYVFQYGLTLQGLGRYETAKAVFEKLAGESPAFRSRAKQFAEACDYALNHDEPGLYKVTNEYANTPSSDFGVALFKGSRIVYSSGRTDVQSRDSRNLSGQATGNNRLFITQRDKNGFLETPLTLHNGFGENANEGPVTYSPDGNQVAITKNNFQNGVRQIPSSGHELTLYLAQVDENGDWKNAIPFPHNGVGYSTGYPAFSQDGNALYFSSNRPGGYGGYDLYVSYKTGSTWAAPENLGPAVNSLGNEISPFHDGTALYFSSDYHRGFGGFDIFKAEENNNRWATIYHTGSGLNSSSDDYGFVYDALRNYGYFVSNRPGGKGNEDIYRIMKEAENIVIKVSDAADGTPIPNATIDFADCGDRSYETDRSGVFTLQMLEDLNCSAIVSKAGYMSRPIRINSPGIRQSKTIEVALTNENSAYNGKVINGATGYALDDVRIIVTNQQNNKTNRASSNARGEYVVALQPGTPYLLRFSKSGFQDISLNLRPAANEVKTIQNIELLPVGAASAQPPALNKNSRARPTPAEVTTPANESKSIQSGYAVQLAAVNSANPPLASIQQKFKNEGTVYAVTVDGKTKIRLGVFENRADAEIAAKSCKKKGHSGAFIVTETDRKILNSTQMSKRKTPAASPSNNTRLRGIMVKLAAYSDLRYFDQTKVEDLGIINKVSQGKYTIVLLTGFDSHASADVALRKAKVRGFQDAYLVEQVNGQLKKVH